MSTVKDGVILSVHLRAVSGKCWLVPIYGLLPSAMAHRLEEIDLMSQYDFGMSWKTQDTKEDAICHKGQQAKRLNFTVWQLEIVED